MGHKCPYFYDLLEGKPLLFTNFTFRVQLLFLTTFLKVERHSWLLKEFWTDVGMLTGDAASTFGFNRSYEHISVSIFMTEIAVDVFVTFG